MLVSDQVPDVLIGDLWRFRQIITNLVGNSMKVRFKSVVASLFQLAGKLQLCLVNPITYLIQQYTL